jgi:PIN domain nuclease of toxin-antitoxin system
MKLLLDTHLLLWAAGQPDRLSAEARDLLDAPDHELLFSTASLWEIVIKRGLGRSDFQVDSHLLRRGLRDRLYQEVTITSDHALALTTLPLLHRDPFDRILVAQAISEGVLLLTLDRIVAQYPGPIRLLQR